MGWGRGKVGLVEARFEQRDRKWLWILCPSHCETLCIHGFIWGRHSPEETGGIIIVVSDKTVWCFNALARTSSKMLNLCSIFHSKINMFISVISDYLIPLPTFSSPFSCIPHTPTTIQCIPPPQANKMYILRNFFASFQIQHFKGDEMNLNGSRGGGWWWW